MNPLIPLAAIAGASLYGTRGRRAKAPDFNITEGELQFYRGGKGSLRPGPAYFSSAKWLAEFYGPVKEYRLYLRNPKFVSENEWGDFDSNMLRFDPSPVNRLRAQGYDSAVWVKGTPQGTMYNVFALSGLDAIKPTIRAAYEEAEWGSYDEDERLALFRNIAERLDIDVSRLTTYQEPGDYTEVYDGGIRVWFDRPTPDDEALQAYIKQLIRQKIDVR